MRTHQHRAAFLTRINTVQHHCYSLHYHFNYLWICHLILKSHQMALFSFHILHKELNKNMLIVVSSHAELQQQQQQQPPPWSQRLVMIDLCRTCAGSHSAPHWEMFPDSEEWSTLENSAFASKTCVSHCEHEEMSPPDLRSAATLLDIYRMKWAQKSTNIFRWKRRKNRWKQGLFCIRSVFMLSLWHHEHLAVASSAPRVVTSNGLLRASQGDYLCTISRSLWSLCDNSILS